MVGYRYFGTPPTSSASLFLQVCNPPYRRMPGCLFKTIQIMEKRKLNLRIWCRYSRLLVLLATRGTHAVILTDRPTRTETFIRRLFDEIHVDYVYGYKNPWNRRRIDVDFSDQRLFSLQIRKTLNRRRIDVDKETGFCKPQFNVIST